MVRIHASEPSELECSFSRCSDDRQRGLRGCASSALRRFSFGLPQRVARRLLTFEEEHSREARRSNMCGIVGYVGTRQAAPLLLEGLKRLEYRGYDSAGVALVQDPGVLEVSRTTEGLGRLEGKIARLNGHAFGAHV